MQFSKKLEGEKYVSPHFQVKEFACHDGSDYIPIDNGLVFKLEKLRKNLGNVPIIINSAYRSRDYNRKIGGVSESYHLYGKAVDITVKGKTPKEIAHAAQSLWFNGIGRYDTENFVHLDVRKKPAFWLGHGQIPVETFGNFVSFKISDISNLKSALYCDGWDPQSINKEFDNNLDNILKYCQIRKGSEGNATRLVQSCVGVNPDGVAGQKTRAAIIEWQKKHGLFADGIFGYKCWKKAIKAGY